ncbi:hypothetical protein F5Y15DRAFT_249269 [Xylariaceae sp. FL0016]|nr:hypothetical protein F5Y15DRAFT_249269 [Xylariaceae sp. FL0016]
MLSRCQATSLMRAVHLQPLHLSATMASGYNPMFGNDGRNSANWPGGFHGNVMPPAEYRFPGAYVTNQGAHYPFAPHMQTPFSQGPAYVSGPVGYQHPVPFFPGTEDWYPRPHTRVGLDFPGMNVTPGAADNDNPPSEFSSIGSSTDYQIRSQWLRYRSHQQPFEDPYYQ